jgi:hypothetical protein
LPVVDNLATTLERDQPEWKPLLRRIGLSRTGDAETSYSVVEARRHPVRKLFRQIASALA